ncbi:MAG: UDP-N-acetylmuramate dehydrogenase [Proteobacteria bacterium]|nr:MAG: UDP-N-acetylmuramate dehydrogenase [Pseudomonadota bacterium]
MGALAGLLHARGIRVTGSDRALYPPMSDALARWGIPVALGFDAKNVLEPRPDLVVIGNSVRADNPEAQAVFDAGIAYRSFPDALYQLAMAGRHSVVVAGTHGKTTTTSLLGALLANAGRDPSVLVGGVALDFDGPFREGAGPHFVVEGDEYDTAFFDKTPKFWHYHPETLLLTSVEFDHADIYRDLDHVKDVFRQLVRGVPASGTIIAALDDADVCDVLDGARCKVVGYGVDEGEHGFRAVDLVPGPEGTRFRVVRDERDVATALVPMYGRHNVANAVGAIATAVALGVPVADAAAALAGFRGVRRRQEIRGTERGVTVLDDFAHHPTAVRETIAAMRMRFPGRRLVAVLEPRSNTSRRALFQRDFADALAGADRAVVAIVPHEPIYSATGAVTEYLDAERLAGELRAGGHDAIALGDVPAIVEDLAATSREGDVVLVMSNGDFGGLWGKLLERLRAQ